MKVVYYENLIISKMLDALKLIYGTRYKKVCNTNYVIIQPG